MRRFFVLLLVLIPLFGCIYLPIPGPTSVSLASDSEISALIGKPASTVVERIGEPRQIVSEPDKNHYLYLASQDYGLVIPLCMYCAPGFAGETVRCYRFTFDMNGNLVEVDSEHHYTASGLPFSDKPVLDCRSAFWKKEELAALRLFYEKSFQQGDHESAFILADEHSEFAPIRKIASEGDVDAAFQLAKKYYELEPLQALAASGNHKAMRLLFKLGQRNHELVAKLTEQGYADPEFLRYLKLRGVDQNARLQLQHYYGLASYDPAGAHKLLCKSADGGVADARYNLALIYEHGENGIQRDYVRAYMWYILSAQAGSQLSSKHAARVATEYLAPEDLSKAEQAIQEWKPGQCEKDLASGAARVH
jgi:TPR repeat protein